MLGQWINGREAAGGSGETIEIVNPADRSVVATLTLADAADVDNAVAAADAAFAQWSTLPPVERGDAMLRLADRMSARADEYARIESQQAGKPIRLTTGFDVPGSIDNVRFFAGAARHLQGSAAAEWDGDHTSTVRREPIGVGRVDRAVELPTADGDVEAVAGDRCGQHGGPQAQRAHAVDQPDGR